MNGITLPDFQTVAQYGIFFALFLWLLNRTQNQSDAREVRANDREDKLQALLETTMIGQKDIVQKQADTVAEVKNIALGIQALAQSIVRVETRMAERYNNNAPNNPSN